MMRGQGVGLSQHGCVKVDIQTKVQEGKRRVFILKGKPWKCKRNNISGWCSGATRVPSGGNTASEEPVKSRSSRLKSNGGSGREMEISHRGGPEVRRRYKSGGLSKDLA